MTTKLTDVFVSKLRAGRKYAPGTIIWDQLQTGLGIKLLPSGKKVFVLQAKFPGNRFQARRTLGEYPGFSLAEARRKAESWRQLARRGIDPVTVGEEERRRFEAVRVAAAARRENTLASYAEKFISERRNRRAKADAREIRRMLLPALGDKPISEITAQDVRVVFDRLKVHAPFDARNAWGHL